MKAFKILMWVISVLCVMVITLFAWCYFFVDRPQTIGVVNISTLSAADEDDTPLEDSTVFIEANIMNNKNNNGQTLAEINFTSYISTSEAYKESGANVHSYGYQLYDFDFNKIINSVDYTKHNEVDSVKSVFFGLISTKSNFFYNCYLKSDVYAYEMSYLGDSCESLAVPYVSSEESFIVSIKNKTENIPMKLSLRGNSVQDLNFINVRYSSDSTLLNWSIADSYRYFTIDMNFLISQLMFTFKNLEQGTHYFNLDLSDYFECRLYNEETKQFDLLTADKEYTYVTIRANVSNDGVTTHNQSIFGMIADNDGSVTFENDSTSKYWKTVNNIVLTVDDFRKRESLVDEGHYLYLSIEDIAELNSYDNNRIHIQIDLSENAEIIGFDNYALDKLNIYSCSISSDIDREFNIMPNALDGTNLTMDEISLNNVTLIDLGGIYE